MVSLIHGWVNPAHLADTTIIHGDETSQSLIQDIDLGAIEATASVEATIYLLTQFASTRVIDFSLQASLTAAQDETQRIEEVNHTVSIPVIDPFRASSTVTYRHASQATGTDGVEGWATVMSLLLPTGHRPLTATNINIQAIVSDECLLSRHARLILW